MIFLDMVLEPGVGCEAEMDGTSICIDSGNYAIGAEESREAMHSVFVFAETGCAIKSSIACSRGNRINICTLEGR